VKKVIQLVQLVSESLVLTVFVVLPFTRYGREPTPLWGAWMIVMSYMIVVQAARESAPIFRRWQLVFISVSSFVSGIAALAKVGP
jgi:hypothetical protein